MLVSDLLPPVHRGNRQKGRYSVDMRQSPKDQFTVWSTRLTHAACTLWLISLVLPGFMAGNELWPGWSILVFGTIAGWLGQGWAVFANIFFIVAAIVLLKKKQPLISIVLMLSFAASLPAFKGIPNISLGGDTPVQSWGWGAGIWLSSLVLLATAAAIQARWFSRNGAIVVAIALLAGFVPVGVLHFQQSAAANSQERAFYLSDGMAYTRESPCGMPLTAVDAPLLPSGAIVALDIDPALADGSKDRDRPPLSLLKLRNYQEDGFAWVTEGAPGGPDDEVKIRMAVDPDRPVLQARKTKQGAVLRLLSRPAGTVLYEQELTIKTTARGSRQYCPMPSFTRSRPFSKQRIDGYATNILRAVGQEPVLPQRAKLGEEVARILCNLGTKDKNGIKGLREWDGREVILREALDVGFCSTSYIVLPRVTESSTTGFRGLNSYAMVYDRKTLRPLAFFASSYPGPCSRKRCESKNRNEIATGVRISDVKVIVETAEGDLAAARFR